MSQERRTIFVFGATGYVGSHISKQIRAQNGHVVKVSLRGVENPHDLTMRLLGPRRPRGLHESFGNSVAIVAAAAGVNSGDLNPKNFRFNSEIRPIVARTLASMGFAQVIVLGSCFEFGKLSIGEPVSPHQALNPIGKYGHSLAIGFERLLQYRHKYGLPISYVRLFQVFGGRESNRRLFPYLVQRVMSNLVPMLEHPAAIRDFTFVEDIAQILVALARNGKPDGEVVNLSSGYGTSVLDFARFVGQALGRQNLVPDPKSCSASDMPYLVGAPSGPETRVRQLTGEVVAEAVEKYRQAHNPRIQT